MRLPEWDKFLDETVGYVKFFWDRADIRRELQEHIEDIYDDLVSEGVDEKEAERLAVEYMGDAEEIGRALNKEHNPFLGWVWIATRIAAVFVAVSFAGYLFSFGTGVVRYFYDDNEYVTEAEMLYEVECDEKIKIDHSTITINGAEYYDNGEMVVKYRIYNDIFAKTVDWSFGISAADFTDEKGNKYYGGGGFSSGKSIGSVGFVVIDEFPYDSDMLIMDSDHNGRRLYAEIPLKEAREAAK